MAMTTRERFSRMFSHQAADRVPIMDNPWPTTLERWHSEGMPKDANWQEFFGLDRGAGFGADNSPRFEHRTIEETDEWRISRNAWGSTFKHWKHRAGTPEHIEFAVSSPEVWKNEFREAFRAIDMRKQIDWNGMRQAYKDATATDKFVETSGLFIFEDMRRILGDVTMLESMLLEPEWIQDFCTVLTDKYMEYFEIFLSEVGVPDGAHIYEDLGYTQATFISPALHRELVFPHHKRLFDLFKSYKLPVILHTCGEIRPHIPAIIESGVDCIEPLEAKTGMNVLELAQQYKGQVCFMGNIDVRELESGDRERMKKEVLTKLKGMTAMKLPYIFMSDHSISPAVKLADYEYMLELFWENSRY